MKERILSINPHCHVLTYDDFFLPGKQLIIFPLMSLIIL